MFESLGVEVGVSLLASSPGAVVADLAGGAGSPGAMAILAGTNPRHLTSAERVDLVRAWERQAAWVSSQQLQAIAALADPGAGEGRDLLPDLVEDWCREELSVALHVTGGAAQTRLDLARQLRARLVATAESLAVGVLTERKADLIARAVRDLPDAVATAVEAAVLPEAAGLTPPELQRALARAVLAVDPDGAGDRAAEARAGRRVTGLYRQPDGMAGLWAELPAADAATVLAGLDADAARLAQAQREQGVPVADRPGVEARRADALLAWARQALTGPDLPRVQGRRPHVQVTVPAGTLLGLSDAPGELAGYGPIDADTARRLAADGTWRRILTDPRSGALLDYGRTTYHPPADLREHVLAAYPRCTFPGCGRPARGCHLDHVHEWRHGGHTCAENLHPLCLRHHTCKTTGTWSVTRERDGGLTWTSPTGRTAHVPPPRLHPPPQGQPPPARRPQGDPALDPPPF